MARRRNSTFVVERLFARLLRASFVEGAWLARCASQLSPRELGFDVELLHAEFQDLGGGCLGPSQIASFDVTAITMSSRDERNQRYQYVFVPLCQYSVYGFAAFVYS